MISLAFLVGLTVGYLAIITPLATVPVPGGYRFPFTLEAGIYALFFALYLIHFVYRLFRPFPPAQEAGGGQPPAARGESGAGGGAAETAAPGGETAGGVQRAEARRLPRWQLYGALTLRPLFFLVIGGAYLTGAMIYSPHLFEFVPDLVGAPVVAYAINVHAIFGSLIVILGVILLAFELGSAAVGRRLKAWFFRARYPEIKVLYWVLGIAMVLQAVTGLLLLGALSAWGPFGLFPQMALDFERSIRAIHGPLGAVIFSVFLGHIYLRLRPEYRLR